MTKLSNKQIAKSLINFAVGTLGLYVIVILTVLMNTGTAGFAEYFRANSQPILTVAVAYAVLSAVMYCYFFFENKYVLSRFSKPCELFLIMYIDFFIVYILSRYVDTLARPIAFVALMCATLFRRRDAIFINSVFSLMILMFDRILNVLDTNMYYSYACLLGRFCTGIVAVFIFNSIKTRFQSVLLAFILLIPVEAINSVVVLPVTHPTASEILDLFIFGGVSCILTIMLYM